MPAFTRKTFLRTAEKEDELFGSGVLHPLPPPLSPALNSCQPQCSPPAFGLPHDRPRACLGEGADVDVVVVFNVVVFLFAQC